MDNCARILCQVGHICEKGACSPVEDECNGECQEYEFCDNGKCADQCALIDCHEGYDCKKGQCFKVNQICEGNKECKDYERCFQGECRDNCEFLRCANCVKGVCGVFPTENDLTPEPTKEEAPECENDYQCGWGYDCNNGQCVDKCSRIKCGEGKECNAGLCLPKLSSRLGVNAEKIADKLKSRGVRGSNRFNF